MNILFVCGDYYPNLGGAVSLVDDLACAFQEKGHSVDVLMRRWAGLTPHETHHGYGIHRLDYPVLFEKFDWNRNVLFRSPGIFKSIWTLLRKRKIDTVCIGLLDMSAWYLIVLRPILRFRLVLYLHGGELRWLCEEEPSFIPLVRASLHASRAVIAVSEALSDEADRFVAGSSAKTHVIVNAIDLKRIRDTEAMHHPRRYIAAIGRLVKEKDFATLLRAYAEVQRDIGEIDLVFAGDGDQRTALEAEAAACTRPGRVIFLGRVEREVALSVLKGAMFLVLPSTTEGFPIVAVEALALGKPVIGTRIVGIQSVIEDGKQGSLFASGDVPALASLLKMYCLDEPYLQQRSAAAMSCDLDVYDMSQVADRHLQVFAGS